MRYQSLPAFYLSTGDAGYSMWYDKPSYALKDFTYMLKPYFK